MKTTWVYYAMLALIVEKIVQHVVVTLAFYFNWTNIGAEVVVNPRVLMVSGAIVAGAFALDLWGMVARRRWAVPLAMALSLFDIVGEFVAQGKIAIVITVSFIVAVALLLLAVAYRRQIRKPVVGG